MDMFEIVERLKYLSSVIKMKEIIFELTDEVERLKREVELLKSTR